MNWLICNTVIMYRVTIAQYDIQWENKRTNLNKIKEILFRVKGKTDLVVLPEMCTTGFSMNVSDLAENETEETILSLKKWATELDLAIAGSFIAKQDKNYFNRGFFITPENISYYDKRHLFRMGEESLYYKSGKNKLIVEHKGVKVCLLICYDLRFPVWARNKDKEYDLLLYVANWPESRIKVWKTLLSARVIENMSYVCGVNRIGVDGLGLNYNGNSMILNAKGEIISNVSDTEQIETIEISLEELYNFRNKFPVWKDADDFEIKITD